MILVFNVGVLLALILIGDTVIYHSVHAIYHSTGVATVSNTDSETRNGFISGKNTVKVDGKNYKYTQKKTYSVNKTDTSWSYAEFNFSKITIYKLDKTYKTVGVDKESANCIIVLDMSVKAFIMVTSMMTLIVVLLRMVRLSLRLMASTRFLI